MYSFNQDTLLSRISLFRPEDLLVLSTAAATRQLNCYEWYVKKFGGSPSFSPRKVAEALWASIKAGTSGDIPWNPSLEGIMSLFPEEAPLWSPWHALAEDSLASLAYALRVAMSHKPQDAVWALRRAYEAADQAAIRMLGLQSGIPENEAQFRNHLVVQRELARQDRDLLQLLERPNTHLVLEIEYNAFAEHVLTDDELQHLKVE